MNQRKQKLLELMNRNFKISTLINYRFKISEITNAIASMNNDLYKQQKYFLELENNRKYRNKIQRKFNKNKKIKKKLNKILNKYLTQIKKFIFFINKYKKEPQQLFEILSELNLFVGELINQENITDEELQYLFTISHQFSEQLKNEKPLDLSLSSKKQRLQQEPLDLSLPNKNQIWELTTKINTSLIIKKHYNNKLETHTKDSLFIEIKISKPSSSFIYTNNFNDIQTYLLSQQIQQNNFLNNNDKSTYRNKTDENEKKSQIITFRQLLYVKKITFNKLFF
ncbi:hypothetical protein [Spiroplasma endosymbiont of Melieria omissa]|uniref:hypothetical protein n=1 Tax=Spiroplasma endosymbiont of Melieria omissa TaxID=3139324 RepID=UPI003CCB1934